MKLQSEAFYNSESGVHFTIFKLEEMLKNATLNVLPSSIGNNTEHNLNDPDGFEFVISKIIKVSNKLYSFNSTGYSDSAKNKLKVTFKRLPAVEFGAFGDKNMDVGNTAAIYSYNSNVINDPLPANSTGEADIGSNENLTLNNKCDVDGDVLLGKDQDGVSAVFVDHGGDVSGVKGGEIDRVDPDPLGLVGGMYQNKLNYYKDDLNNDNNELDLAYLEVSDVSGEYNFKLDSGENATLSSCIMGQNKANYFFYDIQLKNNSNLIIDTSCGPVNIYLTGSIDAVTGSNIINTSDPESLEIGKPYDFNIFANSKNTGDSISIGNSVKFSGFIYAPYMDVRMDNSANIYGSIMAGDLVITNSVVVYFDVNMKDKYDSSNLILASWLDV
jgi:hypothetical protein